MGKMKTIYHDVKKLGQIFCITNSKGRSSIAIWTDGRANYDNTTYASFTGKIVISDTEYFSLNKGLLHSFDDEPAVIRNSNTNLGDNLTEFWYDNGVAHRENGPATIDKYGGLFFLHGEQINSIEEYMRQTEMTDEEKIELVLKYG